MSSAVATEQELNDVNNEFEEDFTLMTGQTSKINQEEEKDSDIDDVSAEEEMDSELEKLEEESDYIDDQDEYDSDSERIDGGNLEINPVKKEKDVSKKLKLGKNIVLEEESDYIDEQDEYESDLGSTDDGNLKTKPVRKGKDISKRHKLNKADVLEEIEEDTIKAKKRKVSDSGTTKNKKANLTSLASNCTDDEHDSLSKDQISEPELEEESENKGAIKKNEDGSWEDIYGRLRAKDGAVINVSLEKFSTQAHVFQLT